jgi:hypothetical protein
MLGLRFLIQRVGFIKNALSNEIVGYVYMCYVYKVYKA